MPQSKKSTSGMGSIRKITKVVKGKEFPQVITFCNKSSQYISKYMRFRNFLVTLLTTVYYPISLL